MKILSKLLTAIVAMTIVSTAFADERNHFDRRGAHNYQQHNYQHRGRCGSDCAAVLFGSAILGTVIINEMQPRIIYEQPQIVYESPPVYEPQQAIYVRSSFRCNGGTFINHVYYCPVLR